MTPAVEAPGVVAYGAAEWAEARSMVDRIGWVADDREISELLASAVSPDGVLARSLRVPDRGLLQNLHAPTLYAVDADLTEVSQAGRTQRYVSLREAAIYTNHSDEPQQVLVFRAFPNGQELHAQGLAIQGVWADNQAAAFVLRDTLLLVHLPEPLGVGERVRLMLHALQDVPRFDPRQPLVGDSLDPEGVGSYGFADGVVNLGNWLPLLTPVGADGRFDTRDLQSNSEHAYFEPALFHVVLSVPSAYAVASTGVEVARVEGEGRTTVVAVAGGARDFAVELLSSGAQLETEVGGTRLRVFFGADEPAAGRHVLEYAEGALRTYTAAFGPLAIAELDVVEAPIRVAEGVEFPGLVTVDLLHKRRPYHRNAHHEFTVAHEVAHQWWSAEVGNDPAREAWIDEGLCGFSAALYASERYGVDAIRARDEHETIEPLRLLGARAEIPADREAHTYDLAQYASVVYGRSALFFQTLCDAIGTDACRAATTQLHARFRYRFATAADVVGVFSQAADDPDRVQALYERWIRQGHPIDTLLGGP